MTTNLPKYNLKSFRKVHRQEDSDSPFGHNQPDPAKMIDGFELYSSKCLHRLLAKAFLANPDGKCCVNHIDGNKLNNSLANLEWCTYSENMQHAYRIGLCNVPQPMCRKVIDICTGVEYNSIKEVAEALHINPRTCNHYLYGRFANPTCLRLAA